MTPVRLTSRWRDAAIGLLALAGVALYVAASSIIHEVGFPLDDSWIHQTYARNLAERGEWAFVPGEPSVASTSPLYTVLLAAGYLLNARFFVWTFALGAAALAAAGWLGARAAEQLHPALPRVGTWTGLAIVLAWHLVWAAASGMETMLFGTLSLAVVWIAWRELGDLPGTGGARFGRGLLLGGTGAALTLTRPEGAGLVALAGAMLLLARPFGDWRQNWRAYTGWGVGFAAGWLAGVAPYLALNLHIDGSLLPNTASAKQAENAPALELPLVERYARMLLPLVAGGQIMLLPGLGVSLCELAARVRSDRRAILFFLPLAWMVVQVSAYALRLPAPYQHGRYVIPILPHILLYGVGGTVLLVERSREGLVRRVLARSLGLSAVAILAGFWVLGAQVYGRDVRIIDTEMVDTAQWVSENLPPEELLAVHDIGALGYYAPRPILDLAGLVSPEVVPIIRDHEALMQFMCERNARYLMVLPDQRPAALDDPRLGAETIHDPETGTMVRKPVFDTGAPYSPAAGGGNMRVYALQWPERCD